MRGVVTVGEAAIDRPGPPEEQTIDGELVDPELAAQMKDRVLLRILSGVQQVREAGRAARQS